MTLRRIQLAAILIALAACGDNVCTLIGCSSGVTVHLATKPTVAYRIEVASQTSSSPARYVFDCPDPTKCSQDAFFPDFTPGRFTVTVITSTGTRLTEVANPMWQTTHPNGPTCGSGCMNTTVIAELPS